MANAVLVAVAISFLICTASCAVQTAVSYETVPIRSVDCIAKLHMVNDNLYHDDLWQISQVIGTRTCHRAPLW